MATIYQSGNTPIILKFEGEIKGEIETSSDVHAILCTRRGVLKHWTKDTIDFGDVSIFLPLTQEETAAFPVENAVLEFKWLGSNGYVKMARAVPISIEKREDKHLLS